MGIPHSEKSAPLTSTRAPHDDVKLGTDIALHVALDTHEPRTGYRAEFDDRTPRYGQYGMVLDPAPDRASTLNAPRTPSKGAAA